MLATQAAPFGHQPKQPGKDDSKPMATKKGTPAKRGSTTPRDEIRKDAEAIVRVLNSPNVPQSVRYHLGTSLDAYMDEHRDTSVDIVAALLTACNEEEGGAR